MKGILLKRGCMTYLEYIQSKQFQHRGDLAKEFYGFRCAICNSEKPLQAHHRTYDRLGREEFTDLIPLCDDCHAIFSQRLPVISPEVGTVLLNLGHWVIPGGI